MHLAHTKQLASVSPARDERAPAADKHVRLPRQRRARACCCACCCAVAGVVTGVAPAAAGVAPAAAGVAPAAAAAAGVAAGVAGAACCGTARGEGVKRSRDTQRRCHAGSAAPRSGDLRRSTHAHMSLRTEFLITQDPDPAPPQLAQACPHKRGPGCGKSPRQAAHLLRLPLLGRRCGLHAGHTHVMHAACHPQQSLEGTAAAYRGASPVP
jgi:hypothetical protein